MLPEVTPTQAQAHLADGALLLDVRELNEWEAARVEGALHIPLGELPKRFRELPAGRAIICICHSGSRSGKAQRFLLSAINKQAVYNLTGGILRWSSEGLPLRGFATRSSRNGGRPV
ncbi:MAG: rhodanese-like domain-containing protein [Vulcanimicrobiaceae bacterium]